MTERCISCQSAPVWNDGPFCHQCEQRLGSRGPVLPWDAWSYVSAVIVTVAIAFVIWAVVVTVFGQ